MFSKPEDTYTAELQTVLRIAHALKEATGIACPPGDGRSPTGDNATMAIDLVRLPSPQPLFLLPLDSGITPEVASAANEIYQRRAEELRQYIQNSVIAAYHRAAESSAVIHVLPSDLLMKRIVSIFADGYSRRLEEWKEEIAQRVRQASNLSPKAVFKNSRAFNPESIPLLEQFFEENAFPTHTDKVFLAKKSNMEYRQVHVWFQNRRNRTKREGKALRKKPTYEATPKPLYKCKKGRLVSDYQAPKTSKRGESGMGIARSDVGSNTLLSSSPPHAFPSPYPPVCSYDPFPCKSGPVRFSKPDWRRSSYQKHPLPLSTDIDELVERFSRLSVRDEIQYKGSFKPFSCAATAAITIVPCRAPHPSLLPCESRQPPSFVHRFPIIRAGGPGPKVFQKSDPDPKSTTLVPPSVPLDRCKLSNKRKIAPLPQRFPGRTSNIYRGTTPSESSSSSSTSPRLLSPDFGSRSCSFSTVGSLSTPSDIPNTQELPHLLRSPHCSPFNSLIHPCNLGDIAATMRSIS